VLRSAASSIQGTGTTRVDALASVTAASDHISEIRGEQGSRAARIDAVRERLTTVQTGAAEERSALEETDVAATIAHIHADQLSLDAAQAAFAKVNRRTLFDLLG